MSVFKETISVSKLLAHFPSVQKVWQTLLIHSPLHHHSTLLHSLVPLFLHLNIVAPVHPSSRSLVLVLPPRFSSSSFFFRKNSEFILSFSLHRIHSALYRNERSNRREPKTLLWHARKRCGVKKGHSRCYSRCVFTTPLCTPPVSLFPVATG